MKLLDIKIISEVRFRPNLTYYDDMFKIASSIEADYEDWGATHNPSMAQLTDKTHKKKLVVTPDVISATTENPELVSQFQTELDQIFKLFLEPTHIHEIRRVGVRKMAIYELSHSYKQLVEKFYEAFYADTEYINTLAADKVEDVAFILDGIKDGVKTRVRIGPLQPEQKETHFQPEFSESVLNPKKSHLFVDVDISNDVPADPETHEKGIENIFALNDSIFKGFLAKCMKDLT